MRKYALLFGVVVSVWAESAWADMRIGTGPSTNVTAGPDFRCTAPNCYVNASAIENALNAMNDVHVEDSGTIHLTADVIWASSATLTVNAGLSVFSTGRVGSTFGGGRVVINAATSCGVDGYIQVGDIVGSYETRAPEYFPRTPYSGTGVRIYRLTLFEHLASLLDDGAQYELACDLTPKRPELAGMHIYTSFTGTIDGRGHAIHAPSLSYGGVFQELNGAAIRNLTIVAPVDVTAATIAQTAINSTLTDVTILGAAVTCTDSCAGIVASAENTTFERVTFTGSVTATGPNGVAAGIVALSTNSVMTDVSSRATLTATTAHGIYGGTVSSSANLFSSSRLDATTATGIGPGETSASAYFDQELAPNATGSGGLTTAATRLASSFGSFDFESVWSIDAGVGGPHLREVEPYASSRGTVSLVGAAGVVGEPFTLAVTVARTPDGNYPGTVATGTVEVVPDTPRVAVIGTATLTNGAATITAVPLSAAAHAYCVYYRGGPLHLESNLGCVAVAINRGETTTTLSTNDAISASVAPVAPAAGTPTGTVTFAVDGIALPPVVLTGTGTVILDTALVPPGTHTITAEYSGDESFITSSAAGVTTTVPTRFSLSTTAESNSTYSLTLTPLVAGFTGPVHLECTGLPEGAECVFSSNDVTIAEVGTQVALAVQLVQPARASVSLALVALGLSVLLLRKRLRVAAVILCAAACGDSTETLDRIPARTYPFQVVASYGAEAHTADLSVIVD